MTVDTHIPSIASCLRTAKAARRDAELLLLSVLCRDRAWLFSHSDTVLSDTQFAEFSRLDQQRAEGVPVAYLLGHREFWSLDIQVSSAVLIPRADTEILVEWALEKVEHNACRHVLDLGTGSGAIALALAHSNPHLEVTAIDRSAEALQVAASNGRTLDLNVEWCTGNWFDPVAGRQWPLIVSNPPYIAADDPHLEQGDLSAEPIDALVSGVSGYECFEAILALAPQHLLPGGWLLFEHGYTQAEHLRALMQQAGFVRLETRRDLAGQPRVTGGCFQ